MMIRSQYLHRRAGLTVVEILVVLGIIGILVAILLPAVQSVREASRRTACQNNLKQQVTACLNHEATHARLPTLYYGTFLKQPRNALDEFHFHSWRTATLPQLEQSALHNKIELGAAATLKSNLPNLNVRLPVFLCPSSHPATDDVPDIHEFGDGKPATKIIGSAQRADYEVVAGVNYPATPPRATSADLSSIRFGAWGEPKYNTTTGASIGYRVARLSDIVDGLSHTILIGERAGRPDWYRRDQPTDVYPPDDPNTGMDQHQAAWGLSTHIWWLVFGYDQAINDTNATGLFSFHTGGATVGLADGSIHFLSEQMDQESLNALATRQARDTVHLPN